MLISPAYTVLRLKDGSDSIDYWWQLFRSPVVVNEYRRFVKGVAKDRWRIYFKDLQHLEVAIPSHQDRAQIAKRLSSILDCKEALVRRRLDLLAMRGGIIEAGFGGAIV